MKNLAAFFLLASSPAWAVPLTLRQALDDAERLQPDLQYAKLRTVEAEARAQETRAALKPQATFSLGTGYQTSNLQGIGLIFPGIPSRVGPYRTFDARPRVTQTVLDFSLVDRVRASRLRAGQTITEAEAVREDLLVLVATTYFEALEAEARVNAAEARLALAEAVAKQAHDRETSGIGSRLDIARAQQQVETENGLLLASRREVDTLKAQLLNLAGRSQSQVELQTPAETRTLRTEAELVAAARNIRPGLKALRQDADAGRVEARATQNERLPKLAAFGDWGVAGAGPDRSLSTYAIGAQVSVPLWTGRRIEASTAATVARVQQTEARIRKFELEIEQQVRQAWIERESARAEQQAAERGRTAAAQALDLARVRLETGLTTTVDVQVAQSALATADDVLIRSRFAVSRANTRLAWAAGDVRQAFDGQ